VVLGRILRPLAVLALLSALVACRDAPANGIRVLVFTRTAGFHHASILQGVAAIGDLGLVGGFAVDSTDDNRRFTLDNLRRYRAVVFLNTTGDVLDEAQQRDFERYVREGGGYVGVHSATDTEYGWPFYGELVGAWMSDHSEVVPARLVVEDRTHPATAHLGPSWLRTDEWYNFRTNPRTRVHVLATLDESTYAGGSMGLDHPIAWCHPVGSGRSFYTGGGHTEGSYAEPAFRTHLLGGIRYAAGLVPARCAPASTDREGWISLFNGRDLDGFRVVVDGTEASPGTTFTVRDGTIQISGQPKGYLATLGSYRNYVLRYDWRFADPVGTDNSGLLVHIQQRTHTGTWPTCVEVQGMQSDAATLIPLGAPNARVANDKAAVTRALRPGDWNTTEVVSADGTLDTRLNGVPIGTGHTDLREGPVGWQSEGAVLQMRDIRIRPA
jgi:type 1 glutamine amidotransferase